jgi:TDG/mug DNA glycosylase family protein
LKPILPDVLRTGLKLVFCGTAPSRRSAMDRAYYAKPGNKFWPTVHRIGLTPRLLSPAEYLEVLGFGIGLTDLNKRLSGQDDELEFTAADRDRLARRIRWAKPRALAFTSKNAAEKFFVRRLAFGCQPAESVRERVGEHTVVFVLPSTSGLACRSWDERPWRELARFVATHD